MIQIADVIIREIQTSFLVEEIAIPQIVTVIGIPLIQVTVTAIVISFRSWKNKDLIINIVTGITHIPVVVTVAGIILVTEKQIVIVTLIQL